METDLAYYRRRSAEEKMAAAVAVSPKVCAIHLEFARRYDRRIDEIAAEPVHAHLRLVTAA